MTLQSPWKATLKQQEYYNKMVNDLRKSVEAQSVVIYDANGHRALKTLKEWDSLPDGLTAKTYDNAHTEIFAADGTSWGCLHNHQFLELLTKWGEPSLIDDTTIEDAELSETTTESKDGQNE
jgi:hypothetical protein